MTMTDSRGVPVSCDDRVLIDDVEAAHEATLSYVGSSVDDVVALLADSPGFVMGHCFAAGMLTQAMEIRIVDIPFSRAIVAFCKGRCRKIVDLLLPIRYHTQYLGGSHAHSTNQN
jgi:hypothetical protein